MRFDPEARRAARPALVYDEALPVNVRRTNRQTTAQPKARTAPIKARLSSIRRVPLRISIRSIWSRTATNNSGE